MHRSLTVTAFYNCLGGRVLILRGYDQASGTDDHILAPPFAAACLVT